MTPEGPATPAPFSRAEIAKRLLRKLAHPRELAGLLRYRLYDGNEYPYFDLVDFMPRVGTALRRVGPDRLDLQRPVFIAGLRRSGTTLFYRMLNAHSDLHLFNERIPGIRMNGRGQTTWQNIWSVEDPAEFRSISHRYLSPWLRWKGGRWGIKLCLELAHPDPGSVPEAGFLRMFEAWPAARFLAIVRDPRAFVPSAMRRGGHDLDFWADEYNAAVSLYGKARSLYPDRIAVIRYEDLTDETEETLRRACSFVELDYQPAMLEPRNWSVKGPRDYDRGGIRSQTGNWKRLAEEDPGLLERVEQRCFPAASELGYRRS